MIFLASLLLSFAHAARPDNAAITTVQSRSCSTVDLSRQLGAVRSQGNAGWCFAYAAADLVSQKLRMRTSAIATVHASALDRDALERTNLQEVEETAKRAADFNRTKENAYRESVRRVGTSQDPKDQKDIERAKVDLEYARRNADFYAKSAQFWKERDRSKLPLTERDGGNLDQAVRAVAKYGACLEASLPSDGGPNSWTAQDVDLEVHQLVDNELAAGGKPCPHDPGQDLDRKRQIAKSVWHKTISQRCRGYVPGVAWMPQVESYGQKWRADGRRDSNDKERKRVTQDIDDALASGRVAAIGYNSNFLDRPGETGVGQHASVIVGRQCNGDCQCRYQLRNSWGPDCDLYVEPYKKNCNKGHLWVSADDLRDYVFQVVTLK